MASADQLFNRFVDAWNAGERPDVDDYTPQVPDAERGDFLQMVSLFLEAAPSPPLTEEQREAVRAEPAYQASIKLAGSNEGFWSTLLPQLRKRAKLNRDQLVAALAEQLGVPAEQERVKIYYHQMESGQLDPAGVSRRVLDALANLLHTDTAQLEDAGDFRGIVGPTAAGVYMRSSMMDVAMDAPAPMTPGEPDAVDRLFTGGR